MFKLNYITLFKLSAHRMHVDKILIQFITRMTNIRFLFECCSLLHITKFITVSLAKHMYDLLAFLVL